MIKYLSIFFFLLSLAMPTGIRASTLWQEQEIQSVQYDRDSDVRPIDWNEGALEEYKNDKAYDYTEVENDTWWDQFKAWLWNVWSSFWRWLLGDYEASPFWAFVIELLPYLIIAGIIGFIIWVFIKLNPGFTPFKRKDSPEVFFTEEEEIIKSKNIRELIQQALQDNDYRLAVRYYYLLALQQLSASHVIEYEFDKTNLDYAKEIQGTALTTSFQKVTNLYDYVWYGNFTVGASDFEKAQRSFETLENQIPNP